MNFRFSVISIVFSVFGLIGAYNNIASAASNDGATKFVSDLSAQALNTLKAEGVSLEDKEKNVRELLADNFDLNLIGRYVLGAAWRKASEEERTQYQLLFKEFVLRTYSRRFGGYSGQTFKVTGAKPINKDTLVSTEISRPSGPPIEAGWRVREKNGTYKILDVVVAGVSMIVTQRSEFRAVVSKQGVGGLLETLRMQVTKFSAQSK